MNECSGLCGCPEDDTIFRVINYCMSLGIYSYDRPVLAHRAVDFLSTFAIMYLTGQPEGECRSPDPAKVNTKLSEIAVPKLLTRAGRLFLMRKIQNCYYQ